MNHYAYHPYQPDYDGTFGADDEPDDTLRFNLRKIDGRWHVVAIERGHAEHIHRDGFRYFDDARNLRDQIRNGLANGRQLNLNYWDTRAL